MKIVVYAEPCASDAKSNTSRNVEVTVNNKRYSGCGSYLYDYLVNDVWELQYIDNRDPVSPKKQLPRIEFDLQQNKMIGYDGCNNISSDIEIKGNHIKFSAFAGTKLSCPGNETEKIFSTMLSGHTVDYTIENRRLNIYLINDSKLTFTKVE
ncbi:MAG: META domain-containing protein [Ferruginibacter sp.]